MLHKIQKKLQNIKYEIDIFEYKKDLLKIKGWILSEECEIQDISIYLTSKNQRWNLNLGKNIERIDVYNSFNKNKYAKDVGFYTIMTIEGISSGTIWLEYKKNNKHYKLYIGRIRGNNTKAMQVKPYAVAMEYLDLKTFETKSLGNLEKSIKSDEIIDVIIPVYNGLQYFDPLFNSIKKTKMKYRLILINDCSPDERVSKYLKDMKQKNPDIILIENEENIGFVKSVNKGLKCSSNHVALVNTDIEVPEMWLERLMAPILQDEKIASSTPYTNAGTICSFPEIGKDNALFENLDVKIIDENFQKIEPRYTSMPTGVGFCMGMNREAINKVGLLDEENFGKGYGEENDWCQRAINLGMKNVHVENLYVYHKHGGSFKSEDKKRFILENSKILEKKHPEYSQNVARFFETDLNKDIRKYVELNLLLEMRLATTVVFNHNLGGGATSYLDAKEQEILANNEVYCLVKYNHNNGKVEVIYKYKIYCVKLTYNNITDIYDILKKLSPNKIIVNELVSYPRLYEVLKAILNYKSENEVDLTLLIHDFYMVCPTVNLLDDQDKYCGVPCIKQCEQCLDNNKELKYLEYSSMKKWREEWGNFIKSCNHVIAFSNNSKEIIEKSFGKQSKIEVNPHKIDFLPVISKTTKHTKTINIGILGALEKHKGLEVVKNTLEYIEKSELDINIILIGSCGEKIQSKHFIETGKYTRDMLSKFIFEYDIDIFWVSSIWPETFSYTTEEIMKMNFPVACFDIGAPAERVKVYKKGIILSSMEPRDIVFAIKKWHNNEKYNYVNKKILFVVEDITFSSRYRVEHLREQLLYRGITSDCIRIEEVLNVDVKKYESIVVYRSSQYKQVKKLVEIAHRASIRVFYDIDDFIFEYKAISHLDFLKYKEYKNFEEYCDNIKKAMQQCDAYITSTNTLAEQISKSMNSQSVYVNRNVASAEMVTISLAEMCHMKKNPEKVVLGYFSGTKTHDKDFELIKEVLLGVLKKYDNVYLRMGGQIELAQEFTPYYDRIERFDFVSWKKLPNLIAGVDINLMPLENSVFHECKSENKWQEAALVGVPTIASYNKELSGAFSDNIEGCICHDSKEWKEKLERLIEEKDFRNRIVVAAHNKVMDEYTTFSRDISDIILRLCEKE